MDQLASLAEHPRTLFICMYSSEDAVPYSGNPVPTRHEGLAVRGEKSNRVSSTPYEIELPLKPTTVCFFDQQAKQVEKTDLTM